MATLRSRCAAKCVACVRRRAAYQSERAPLSPEAFKTPPPPIEVAASVSLPRRRKKGPGAEHARHWMAMEAGISSARVLRTGRTPEPAAYAANDLRDPERRFRRGPLIHPAPHMAGALRGTSDERRCVWKKGPCEGDLRQLIRCIDKGTAPVQATLDQSGGGELRRRRARVCSTVPRRAADKPPPARLMRWPARFEARERVSVGISHGRRGWNGLRSGSQKVHNEASERQPALERSFRPKDTSGGFTGTPSMPAYASLHEGPTLCRPSMPMRHPAPFMANDLIFVTERLSHRLP
jgi:hypothetical protein